MYTNQLVLVVWNHPVLAVATAVVSVMVLHEISLLSYVGFWGHMPVIM